MGLRAADMVMMVNLRETTDQRERHKKTKKGSDLPKKSFLSNLFPQNCIITDSYRGRGRGRRGAELD
ncbi:hypothetical protein EYF80_034606 [Liparis tanakae]|uniref:Uncharacterized protein n=1 Tax=Liparis tanakae TaxID=230148 RepID=A0A4Z2GPF4_9TELE|nr:hypothetical protein EYF80_034606 [Liparis tanakae]